MIHNRITSEHWAVCQMQRAWDTPKIAVCPDSGCACYSLKSQFSPSQCRSFSPPKSVLYCKKICGRRAFLWHSNGYLPGFIRGMTESPSSLSGCSRTLTPGNVKKCAVGKHPKSEKQAQPLSGHTAILGVSQALCIWHTAQCSEVIRL